MELVRISSEYINELRKVDYRVQSNAVEQGKDTKPFLGVLFTLKKDSTQYFVPLSSPKEKHKSMPNSSDFHKVIDKKGKLRAVLNFNNMLPAVSELCTRIDLHTDKDRFVLMDEYLFCRDNEEMLKKKAQKFYMRYYKGELSESEKKRTCDFKKLEDALKRYIDAKKAKEIKEKLERITGRSFDDIKTETSQKQTMHNSNDDTVRDE